MPDVVEWLRTSFGGFSAVEQRMLASALVFIATAILAGLVTPYLRRRLLHGARQSVREHLDNRDGVVALVIDEFPFGTVVIASVRAFQLVVVTAALFAILVVWGETATVSAILGVFRAALLPAARLLATLALLLGGYFGVDLLEDVVEEVTSSSDQIGEHEQEVVYRFAQLGLFGIVLIGGLLVWGVNPAGLLVSASFLGVVVGFAARQTLGSLVAGFVLMFARPFEIGDWVEIGDTEGIVVDISIINTRLRTFDGEYVAIPNERVGNSVVHNRTQESQLRLTVEVGVDYAADPERAAEVALDAIHEVDAIVDNPAPDVVPVRFGDSAIVLELRFWIHNPSPPRKWQAIRGVVYGVKDAFDRAGIDIPFPQRTVGGREDAPQVPAEAREVSAGGDD